MQCFDLSEISFPHSGHLISAIFFSLLFDIIYNYITKICLLLLLFARLLLAIKDLIGAMSAAGGLTSLGDVAAAASLGFEGLASAIGISTAALGGFLAILSHVLVIYGKSCHLEF